ncbi:MAG: hypothetical protein ABI670_01150 [Chloroflexota bacterium]
MSELVDQLLYQMRSAGLPEPQTEVRFHQRRRWRFDICWPAMMLAVEVDGGNWVWGRHVRARAYEGDCEKQAEAVIEGWRYVRVTGDMVCDGRALRIIERLLQAECRTGSKKGWSKDEF